VNGVRRGPGKGQPVIRALPPGIFVRLWRAIRSGTLSHRVAAMEDDIKRHNDALDDLFQHYQKLESDRRNLAWRVERAEATIDALAEKAGALAFAIGRK